MGKRDLLLDDEQEEQPTIRVNEEYARRFEHNKRREELHRLQEKHPEVAARLAAKTAAEAAKAARQAAGRGGHAEEDESEEESTSDDDDDEELDADDDTDKVLETLVRLKKKDPVLKQPDVVLFPQPADSDEGTEAAAAAADGADKKSKPMYLRTVLAKQALEGGPGSDEEEDGDEAALPNQPVAHSYAAEQQELKQAFLQAAADAEEGAAAADEGGVLRKKAGKRSAAEAGQEGPDKEQQVNQLLDEYFGKDNQLDAAGAFLKSYIANKAWKEPTDGGRKKKRLKGLDGSSSSSEDEGDSSEGGSSDKGGEGDINVDEDEKFLEEVDRFEAAYNFRFEEPGSHRIQSFPRVIEDSVRRPDERRKRQRDAKAARKQAEKDAREAEIRRLKNLKKQEIQDMFTRIQQEAGIKSKKAQAEADLDDDDAAAALSKSGGLANLLDELLEGDFDPDAYDKRMAAAFDEEYYEGDDEHDELFGDAEEELAAEDDVLRPAALATLGDPSEAAGGFALLHQQLQQQQGDDSDEGEGGEDAEGDKGAAAAARAEQRSQLQRKLEEYYKLDCEDNIGGIPCRFKYRQVPAETFGLSVEDILTLPDKELNQIIGMKKVAAPYREDNKRLRPNYKALQRIKGEAAAAAAMRQQKRDKQKHKEAERHQRRQQEQQQQQQRDQAAQADAQPNGVQQQGKHKQQQGGRKRRFEQAHGRPQGQQQYKQHRQQQPSQQWQQQKPLAEMSAEEKQAARLASYAKLTLKPQQQEQQQHANGANGMQHRHKKHKQSGDGEQQGHSRKKQKKEKQPPPQGRLSAVPVDQPLTKAQKKNLLRSLKRKEKKGQE